MQERHHQDPKDSTPLAANIEAPEAIHTRLENVPAGWNELRTREPILGERLLTSTRAGDQDRTGVLSLGILSGRSAADVGARHVHVTAAREPRRTRAVGGDRGMLAGSREEMDVACTPPTTSPAKSFDKQCRDLLDPVVAAVQVE
jgi:hypothetical protein